MFVQQQRRSDEHTSRVQPTGSRSPAHGDQGHNRNGVQHLAYPHRTSSTEGDGDGMETLFQVKRLVLQRVEDVEAGNPGRHCHRQCEQDPCRIAPPAGDSQVAADGGNRQADTEHQVRPAGETLGIGVGEHPA